MKPTTKSSTPRTTDVVVARYNESIAAWATPVAERGADLASGLRLFVYNKGPPGTVLPEWRDAGCPGVQVADGVPNVGREAHTYLLHIVQNYDALADVTVFLQGDPFPHMARRHALTPAALASLPEGDAWPRQVVRESKTPRFHKRVDTHAASAKLLGSQRQVYEFPAGAQYAVSRAKLRSRPLDWWKRLLAMILEDEINAWEVERLWRYVFGLAK